MGVGIQLSYEYTPIVKRCCFLFVQNNAVLLNILIFYIRCWVGGRLENRHFIIPSAFRTETKSKLLFFFRLLLVAGWWQQVGGGRANCTPLVSPLSVLLNNFFNYLKTR